MARPTSRWCASLVLVFAGGCFQQHMHTTDCGFDSYPVPSQKSRVTWTRTSSAGRLEGQIRETGRKGATVRKASVLLPRQGTWDTLHVAVDSTGSFHLDSVAPGRRKVIVQARWYWAAFDTVEFRADSGVRAEVRLEPTPQGWFGCIPH